MSPIIATHIKVSFVATLFYIPTFASALVIAPPSSSADYWQLASLLVSTFDAPIVDESNDTSMQDKMELLQWNLYGKTLNEEYTYKRYASTVRRMRGKKYCLLVAKEGSVEDTDDGSPDQRADVLGMVEMGMSLCPTPLSEIHDGSHDNSHDDADEYNDNSIGLRPQPTIGVLCVKSLYQKNGVGRALVQKCEDIAREKWEEQSICVDVEPVNTDALAFFERCGYISSLDSDGEREMRDATVSRRQSSEAKPHFLLRKRLAGFGEGN
eukprot:scaffold4446_cov199-Alexandrium_tamarense.AAC.7